MEHSLSYNILSRAQVTPLIKAFYNTPVTPQFPPKNRPYSWTEAKRFCYSDPKQQYKTNYTDIFRDQHRLYIQPKLTQPSPTQQKIDEAISTMGYTIHDYSAGIAEKIDDPSKNIKIGKLLKNDFDLNKEFCSDHTRCVDDMLIVLSKHPVDIIQMSTGRAWNNACTARGKGHFGKIHQDLKKGSLIAYQTTLNDPLARSPKGRIMIRPFKNMSSEEILVPLIVKKYGSDNDIFRQTVVDFVEKNINGYKAGIFTPEIADLSENIAEITRFGTRLTYSNLHKQQISNNLNIAVI